MVWGSNTIKKIGDTEPLLRRISRLMSEDRWESNRNKNVWGGTKRRESLKTHVHLTRARVGRGVTVVFSKDASSSCYFGDVTPEKQHKKWGTSRGPAGPAISCLGCRSRAALGLFSPLISGRCRVASRPEWQKEEPNAWNKRGWLLAEGGADGKLPRLLL